MPNKWDEEESGGEDEKPVTRVGISVAKKWDDEEDDVLESWDAAEDSEEERAKAEKQAAKEAEAAAQKKPRAQRISELQAASAARKAAEEAEKLEREKETEEQRKARLQKQEIESDMKHAETLFAGVSLAESKAAGDADVKRKAIALADPKDPSRSIDLSLLPLFNPKTKQQFADLQSIVIPLLTANARKTHYLAFVQELTRQLVKEMSSEQIKKVASICTTAANEKLREEKAAEKGGKKSGKGAKKATLANVSKESDKIDTRIYDDFAEDDFM